MKADSAAASDLQLVLVRRIMDQIGRQRLRAGAHLREQELAKAFKVSRSPVRGALRFLEDQGVVYREVNRGYFLLKGFKECADLPLELPQTNDEQICETIARDWFEQEISEEISETEIRRRYGLGRITGARVLQRLSDEGVITRSPGYGWRFEPTLNTQSAHDESYDFRLMTEPMSILLPTFRFSKSAGEQLRARHQAVLKNNSEHNDISFLFEIDAGFHRFIAQCSGNRFVLSAVERQNRLRRLLEYASLIDTGRLQASCREHIAIIDALRVGDRQLAADLMSRHLREAKEFGPSFNSKNAPEVR